MTYILVEVYNVEKKRDVSVFRLLALEVGASVNMSDYTALHTRRL
jgi:hypothetical protein